MNVPNPADDELLLRQMQDEWREDQAKLTFAEAMERLAQLGVDKVLIAYEGAGESTVIRQIVATAAGKPVEPAGELREALGKGTGFVLADGWEVDSGAAGDLTVDIYRRIGPSAAISAAQGPSPVDAARW